MISFGVGVRNSGEASADGGRWGGGVGVIGQRFTVMVELEAEEGMSDVTTLTHSQGVSLPSECHERVFFFCFFLKFCFPRHPICGAQ